MEVLYFKYTYDPYSPLRTTSTQMLKPMYWQKREILYKYMLGLDRNSSFFDQYMNDLCQYLGEYYRQQEHHTYMNQYYSLIDKELKKLDSRINAKIFLKTLLDSYIRDRGKFMLFIDLFMIPQDLYLLLRVFTMYDSKKLSRGPTACQKTKFLENRNIIVYAGTAHIDLYQSFLNKFFNVSPAILVIKPNDEQCLTLSSPFDFFAS